VQSKQQRCAGSRGEKKMRRRVHQLKECSSAPPPVRVSVFVYVCVAESNQARVGPSPGMNCENLFDGLEPPSCMSAPSPYCSSKASKFRSWLRIKCWSCALPRGTTLGRHQWTPDTPPVVGTGEHKCGTVPERTTKKGTGVTRLDADTTFPFLMQSKACVSNYL
jgi:hypothetical protein